MKGTERDLAMAKFKSGELSVLVATTVIEVGVDVPEATIMVVEHAERFGLAQLHQLRGRVGRGAGKSTCLLVWQAPLSETAKARLKVLRETAREFKPLGKVHENLALQTEFARKMFEIAVQGAQKSASTARQSTTEAVKIIQARVKESFEEIRASARPGKSV